MATSTPLVSVVLNTLDRPALLARALTGLERDAEAAIRAGDVEILVVDQSRNETTRDLCRDHPVTYARHEGRGLAASRNHALDLARGEWIAFLDDDALVRAGWTKVLLQQIERGEAEALAGLVVDAKSGALQFQNGAVHRKGALAPIRPLDAGDPGAGWVPCSMGTNMAFERARLRSIGGFDAFYRYFHEETDVCVRLTDDGGRLRFVPDWVVDHEFAPSERRKDEVDIDYGTITRSLVYFAGRHGDVNDLRGLLALLLSKKSPPRVAARRFRKGRLPFSRLARHLLAIAGGTLEARRALRTRASDSRNPNRTRVSNHHA